MIKGKKGLIIGIANDHSIAWGIAKQLHINGAELAITYQNDTLLKRVKPLADKINADILIECDVNNEDHLQNTFDQIKNKFGKIDFIIHAVAYSDKNELNGRYIDTSKENFINSLSVSCYSFTKIAYLFQPIMNEGGSLVTLSFHGSNQVMPNYNVMGVAKAALESDTRTLAWEAGRKWDMRINAISAGALGSRAAKAIGFIGEMIDYASNNAPLQKDLTADEIGNAAAFLLSPKASAITGTTLYVDNGMHAMGVAVDSPALNPLEETALT